MMATKLEQFSISLHMLFYRAFGQSSSQHHHHHQKGVFHSISLSHQHLNYLQSNALDEAIVSADILFKKMFSMNIISTVRPCVYINPKFFRPYAPVHRTFVFISSELRIQSSIWIIMRFIFICGYFFSFLVLISPIKNGARKHSNL